MEPGSKQDGVVNMTRAIEALSPWLNNPRRTIIQVEALVVTAAALLLLQLIFGCCKRRWHNPFVKGALLACDTLIFPLIIYTLSMMQSSPIKNSSYPVWAVFLIMASEGTVAVQQYDFYGSALKKYGHAAVEIGRYTLYIMMLLLLMSPVTLKEGWSQKHVRFASASSVWVQLVIAIAFGTKLLETMLLLVWEGKVLRYCRVIAKRMRMDDWANVHPSDSDPESMEGYNYLVQFPSVTIDKIWDCCGNSDDGKALKDICLSFALFLLLKRRYLGLACAEARHLKTRRFVLEKLLPSQGEYERVFRILEVELGFCYDYFFTRYGFVYTLANVHERHISILLFCCLALFGVKIICIFVAGVFALRRSLVLETPNPIIEVHTTDADYVITLLVLGIALIVQVLQAAFYLASDWVQVSLACRYVKKNCYGPNALIGKAIAFLRRVTVSGACTNKICQRSLLSGKQGPVEVSYTVKRAIARSLKSTDGVLTNGEASLRQNQNLYHRNGITREDRGVAVNLSRYIAYLIASVPELLPYHEVDIKESLREVVEDEIGEDPWSYEELESVDGTGEEDSPTTVFRKGVKLGKQLESMPDGAQRWKLMGEFWAETLLYVAPSHSTAKQHMKHLENGGEFLTHIWALLSHAGILNLNRDKDQGPEAGETASVPPICHELSIA
ncbi:unnamed protein product [Urochloa decumbens]|uniref:DUF4220 domain-containing protein n=1 Tax=Urochloa decumbens TaxID=240449 RepID=A0ABC9GCK6_9POAL